jgi:hypothetical protein
LFLFPGPTALQKLPFVAFKPGYTHPRVTLLGKMMLVSPTSNYCVVKFKLCLKLILLKYKFKMTAKHMMFIFILNVFEKSTFISKRLGK